MRTISIKGVGKAKRDPDLVIFRISTTAFDKEYASAIDASNRLVNELKNDFKDLGFEKDDLKTTYFTTRQIHESVEVGVFNKRHESQLKGFKAIHDLKIEFDLDNDKINEVLGCLKNYGKDVEFDIEFSVKNKDSMKREVILDATRNARFNAEILAEASSVKLGDLIKIEYNWSDVRFISRAQYDINELSCEYSPEHIEFTPDSIEISDSVSFVWEIQ